MGLVPPKPPESGRWKPQEPENITFNDGDATVFVVFIVALAAALLALVLW